MEALGRYEEAEKAYFRAAGIGAYGQVIDPMKHNPTLHFFRGRTLAKMRRHGEAIEAFDLAIRLQGDLARLWIVSQRRAKSCVFCRLRSVSRFIRVFYADRHNNLLPWITSKPVDRT